MRALSRYYVGAVLCSLLCHTSTAQTPPATAPAAGAPPPNAEAPGGIREISPGIVGIGEIRLDQKARTVTFPGAINMNQGLLEYLIVGPNGPTHESLLVTQIRPVELHTIMLLLGVKGEKPPAGADAPPAQLTREYLQHAPKLTGESLEISVTWKDNKGASKTVEVSDLLRNADSGKAVPRGPWTYSGSSFNADGKFLAQSEDVFGALVLNPSALINNPRKGNDDDRAWEANQKATPAPKTPVTITLKVLEPKP